MRKLFRREGAKAATAPAPSGRYEIGVLFDIDGLGGGMYGRKAYCAGRY